MKSVPFIFSLLLAAFLFVGCSIDKAPPHDDSPNPSINPLTWTPEDVEYTCENENLCPENQGILFMVQKTTENGSGPGEYLHKLMVYRCTATLYDNNKIITAGHCVDHIEEGSQSYFKTVSKTGRPSRIFHVTRALKSKSVKEGFADYGSLELSEPASGVEFANPAKIIPQDLNTTIALVANPKKDGNKDQFILNAIRCQNNKEASPTPLASESETTVFMMENCKIYSGNSGGIVVAETDLNAVLGIVTASTNATDSQFKSPFQLPPLSQPSTAPKWHPDFALASDARCFSLPSWPSMNDQCIESTPEKIDLGIKQARVKTVMKFLNQAVPQWMSSSFGSANTLGVGLQFVPIMTTVKRTGALFFIPHAICVERPPTTNTFEVRLPVQKANIVDYTAEGPKFETDRSDVDIDIKFSRLSENQFQVFYRSQGHGLLSTDSLDLADNSDVATSLRDSSVVLPVCTGQEGSQVLKAVQDIFESADSEPKHPGNT